MVDRPPKSLKLKPRHLPISVVLILGLISVGLVFGILIGTIGRELW
jgi:hypothetical protein